MKLSKFVQAKRYFDIISEEVSEKYYPHKISLHLSSPFKSIPIDQTARDLINYHDDLLLNDAGFELAYSFLEELERLEHAEQEPSISRTSRARDNFNNSLSNVYFLSSIEVVAMIHQISDEEIRNIIKSNKSYTLSFSINGLQHHCRKMNGSLL